MGSARRRRQLRDRVAVRVRAPSGVDRAGRADAVPVRSGRGRCCRRSATGRPMRPTRPRCWRRSCAPPEPFVPPDLVGQKVILWSAAGAATSMPARPRSRRCAHSVRRGPLRSDAVCRAAGDARRGAPPGLRNYFRGGFSTTSPTTSSTRSLDHGARMPSPMSQIHFHQMGGAVGQGRRGQPRSAGEQPATPTTSSLPGPTRRRTRCTSAPTARPPPRWHRCRPAASYVNFVGDTSGGDDRVRRAYGDEIYAGWRG